MQNKNSIRQYSAQEENTARQPAPAPFDMNQLVEALQITQGGNRKQIKAPTFTGAGNVDMFTTQFMDIAHVNRWMSGRYCYIFTPT